jgi:hypothetical protein
MAQYSFYDKKSAAAAEADGSFGMTISDRTAGRIARIAFSAKSL